MCNVFHDMFSPVWFYICVLYHKKSNKKTYCGAVLKNVEIVGGF